jgi:hypothetical protein
MPDATLAWNTLYFVAQVIMPLHEPHSVATGDNARCKLPVCFNNSRCHTGYELLDEMSRLRCKRVSHPPYSPNLPICDFDLFGRIKERLARVTAIDGSDLRSELISISAEIPEEEKVRAFDHWIE